MARIRLTEQLVEAPDEKDSYYKTNVLLDDGSTLCGSATLPDHGKVTVSKETLRYPQEHTSFAWKVSK